MSIVARSTPTKPHRLFAIALLVLCALTLHALLPDHPHPESLFAHHHGQPHTASESIQALLHGEDRKIWLVLMAIVFLFLNAPKNSLFEKTFTDIRFTGIYLESVIPHLSDPIRTALRRGILQSKIYA